MDSAFVMVAEWELDGREPDVCLGEALIAEVDGGERRTARAAGEGAEGGERWAWTAGDTDIRATPRGLG